MNVKADAAVGDDLDAFGPHLLDAALDLLFFEFELRNAVTKQATDAVGALVQSYRMPGRSQLLRTRHSGRTRANDCDLLAGLARIRWRCHVAIRPGMVYDAFF